MRRYRKKIFASAIGDEVFLAHHARRIIHAYRLPLQTTDLLHISQQYGIDVATRCYYESLLQSEHGLFKKTIDGYDTPADINNNPVQKHGIKILVVPGMFYKEHPEVGADGHLVVAIARRCGFEVDVLPINSKGSIAENVMLIEKVLHQEKAETIWFVSLSKGSSEVRNYLQSYPVPTPVKGWLNIAGIIQGSPHADRKLSSPLRKAVYAVISRLINVDYQVLTELNTKHAMWTKKEWDNNIDYIHVVPIPLRAHLQAMLRGRFEKLVQYGPNDGIVPVTDASLLPGKIYPVWGVDHFMRTPKIGELLYKFFSYIAQQHTSN